jgi:hypothetical protein
LQRTRPRRDPDRPALRARRGEDLHEHLHTVEVPLNALDDAALCPGSAALASINAGLV